MGGMGGERGAAAHNDARGCIRAKQSRARRVADRPGRVRRAGAYLRQADATCPAARSLDYLYGPAEGCVCSELGWPAPRRSAHRDSLRRAGRARPGNVSTPRRGRGCGGFALRGERRLPVRYCRGGGERSGCASRLPRQAPTIGRMPESRGAGARG